MLVRLTTAAVIALVAIGLATGPASAAPPKNPSAISYRVTTTGSDATFTFDRGSVAMEGNYLNLRAPQGKLLWSIPLLFRVDDFVFPILAKVTGRTARLHPAFTKDAAVYQPRKADAEEDKLVAIERERLAWTRMISIIATGAIIGSALGTATGAVVGCVLGGAAAGTATLVTVIGAVPAAIAGCMAGALFLAPVGGLVGTIFITLPTIVFAIAQYFTVTNQPVPKQKKKKTPQGEQPQTAPPRTGAGQRIPSWAPARVATPA